MHLYTSRQQWVLTAFVATCHICRKYLKPDVYWYVTKQKLYITFTSPQFINHQLFLLHPAFSSFFLSQLPLFSYFFLCPFLLSTLPMHRHRPIYLPVSPFYLINPSVSLGQDTLRRLSYCPGWGKSIDLLTFWCVPFFSCHRLCLILFASLRRENKACFFVCSGCGLLGQGGTRKPSKSETRFFDLLMFLLH